MSSGSLVAFGFDWSVHPIDLSRYFDWIEKNIVCALFIQGFTNDLGSCTKVTGCRRDLHLFVCFFTLSHAISPGLRPLAVVCNIHCCLIAGLLVLLLPSRAPHVRSKILLVIFLPSGFANAPSLVMNLTCVHHSYMLFSSTCVLIVLISEVTIAPDSACHSSGFSGYAKPIWKDKDILPLFSFLLFFCHLLSSLWRRSSPSGEVDWRF